MLYNSIPSRRKPQTQSGPIGLWSIVVCSIRWATDDGILSCDWVSLMCLCIHTVAAGRPSFVALNQYLPNWLGVHKFRGKNGVSIDVPCNGNIDWWNAKRCRRGHAENNTENVSKHRKSRQRNRYQSLPNICSDKYMNRDFVNEAAGQREELNVPCRDVYLFVVNASQLEEHIRCDNK